MYKFNNMYMSKKLKKFTQYSIIVEDTSTQVSMYTEWSRKKAQSFMFEVFFLGHSVFIPQLI